MAPDVDEALVVKATEAVEGVFISMGQHPRYPMRTARAVLAAVLSDVREAPAVDPDALTQAHANIGPYRTAQSAIGDLDREHIDVLAVGRILSTLRSEVIAMYSAALHDAADLRRQVAEAAWDDGYYAALREGRFAEHNPHRLARAASDRADDTERRIDQTEG